MEPDEKARPQFLTVNQAAKLLQLSRPSIYRLFKVGRLRQIKLGTSTRISLDEIINLK